MSAGMRSSDFKEAAAAVAKAISVLNDYYSSAAFVQVKQVRSANAPLCGLRKFSTLLQCLLHGRKIQIWASLVFVILVCLNVLRLNSVPVPFKLPQQGQFYSL